MEPETPSLKSLHQVQEEYATACVAYPLTSSARSAGSVVFGYRASDAPKSTTEMYLCNTRASGEPASLSRVKVTFGGHDLYHIRDTGLGPQECLKVRMVTEQFRSADLKFDVAKGGTFEVLAKKTGTTMPGSHPCSGTHT